MNDPLYKHSIYYFKKKSRTFSWGNYQFMKLSILSNLISDGLPTYLSTNIRCIVFFKENREHLRCETVKRWNCHYNRIWFPMSFSNGNVVFDSPLDLWKTRTTHYRPWRLRLVWRQAWYDVILYWFWKAINTMNEYLRYF